MEVEHRCIEVVVAQDYLKVADEGTALEGVGGKSVT